MAIYTVRTTGSDTTGDGSAGNPWATLSKGLSMAAAGDTLRVGDGTYAENTAGAGFWNIVKSPASWLTIEGEHGPASQVVIQGASHTSYNTLCQGGANLRFQWLTFTQRAATTSAGFRASANFAGIEFVECTFRSLTNGVTYSYACQINPSDGATAENVAFTRCRWEFSPAESPARAVGLQLTQNGTTGVCRQITLSDCICLGSRIGVEVNGATGVLISGGYYSARGSAAILAGVDGASGGRLTTLSVLDTEAAIEAGGTGHAILIGNGAQGCLLERVRVERCYDYAVVLKEHGVAGGTTVRACALRGGGYSALYFKAAAGAQVLYNTLIASAGLSTGVVQAGPGDGGNKCQDLTLTYNLIVALGNVNALKWADASGDAGGCVCDYNVYDRRGSGVLGNVRLASGITTLAGLQAAWAGYTPAGNDAHSRLRRLAGPEGWYPVAPAWQ